MAYTAPRFLEESGHICFPNLAPVSQRMQRQIKNHQRITRITTIVHMSNHPCVAYSTCHAM